MLENSSLAKTCKVNITPFRSEYYGYTKYCIKCTQLSGCLENKSNLFGYHSHETTTRKREALNGATTQSLYNSFSSLRQSHSIVLHTSALALSEGLVNWVDSLTQQSIELFHGDWAVNTGYSRVTIIRSALYVCFGQ